MKFKQSFLYQTKKMLYSSLITSGVYVLLSLLMLLLSRILDPEIQFNGVIIGYLVFMLVSGIVAFVNNPRAHVANGISRRTCYLAFLAMIPTVSLAIVAEMAVLRLLFMDVSTELDWVLEFLMQSYQTGYLGALFLLFLLLLTINLAGFLIAGAFYRLNVIGRILLAAVGGFILMVLLPLFVVVCPDAAAALGRFLAEFVASYGSLSVMLLLISCLCGACGYLLVRRSPIRSVKW